MQHPHFLLFWSPDLERREPLPSVLPNHIKTLNSFHSFIVIKIDTSKQMSSWKKTITSPFKKACTFFNQQPSNSRDKKSQPERYDNRVMDLHGEVMACGYEDVQVMWSILDKSKSATCNISS